MANENEDLSLLQKALNFGKEMYNNGLDMVVPHARKEPLNPMAYVRDFNEWFAPAAQMGLDEAEGKADYPAWAYALASIPVFGKVVKPVVKATAKTGAKVAAKSAEKSGKKTALKGSNLITDGERYITVDQRAEELIDNGYCKNKQEALSVINDELKANDEWSILNESSKAGGKDFEFIASDGSKITKQNGGFVTDGNPTEADWKNASNAYNEFVGFNKTAEARELRNAKMSEVADDYLAGKISRKEADDLINSLRKINDEELFSRFGKSLKKDRARNFSVEIDGSSIDGLTKEEANAWKNAAPEWTIVKEEPKTEFIWKHPNGEIMTVSAKDLDEASNIINSEIEKIGGVPNTAEISHKKGRYTVYADELGDEGYVVGRGRNDKVFDSLEDAKEYLNTFPKFGYEKGIMDEYKFIKPPVMRK